jgi:hypothetical protein
MLPDIRVVVTAIATTVLILVGIGLMASIRMTHQSLSAQADSPTINRMGWRQPEPLLPDAMLTGHAPYKPEPVAALPHETMDMATLSREERDLAERVLTSAPPPRYAAASLDPADTPQLAARVAEDQALANPANRGEPITTASISPPPADSKTKTPAKKASFPPATAKLTPAAAAKARLAAAHAAKPKRTIRRTARTKSNDSASADPIFRLDQSH